MDQDPAALLRNRSQGEELLKTYLGLTTWSFLNFQLKVMFRRSCPNNSLDIKTYTLLALYSGNLYKNIYLWYGGSGTLNIMWTSLLCYIFSCIAEGVLPLPGVLHGSQPYQHHDQPRHSGRMRRGPLPGRNIVLHENSEIIKEVCKLNFVKIHILNKVNCMN